MAEASPIGGNFQENDVPPKLAEGDDLEDQENEILALSSIYENEALDICDHSHATKDMPGGTFSIPIFPPEPFSVKITKDPSGIKRLALWKLGHHGSAVRGRGRRERQNLKIDHLYKKQQKNDSPESSDESESPSSESQQLYPVKRLPPVTITFAFPHDYPSTNPPQFTLSCCWLDKSSLTKLCEQLDAIWMEHQGFSIVMIWINFLQEELISFLDITSPYDLGRVLIHTVTHPAKGSLPRHYPPPMKRKPFDKRGIQTFGNIDDVLPKVLDFNLLTCEVCFEEQAGENFLRLISCNSHVLCKKCSRGWFEEQIREGAVSGLTCPGYKCDKQVLPTEIATVVSPELYQRYDRLLLKTAMDTMKDVCYCPRPHCQFPVVLEDNAGLCQKCNFAFCGRCKNTYHGHSPCKLKADMFAPICKEYENCSDERRLELEMRYGKQVIKNAIEETHSERWKESNSKQCPSCSTFIQKFSGCNQVKCGNCGLHFCWLCYTVLSRFTPYKHYSTDSLCNGRLFEGVDMAEHQRFWLEFQEQLEQEVEGQFDDDVDEDVDENGEKWWG